MHVAIYARHSTDKQETSTQDQIRRCREYCSVKGYQVADVFFDEGISGSHIANRPGIGALLVAALNGRFEGVVAEDLSRISRDQADTANFFKKMMFLGLPVETVTDGVINELHIGLKSTMNALYLKDLSDKTHRGVIAAVLRGGVPGGQLYGYDLVHALDEFGEPIRGKRKINEEQAEIIREIFEYYAEGRKLKHICDDLNRRGIDSPKGGKWAPSSLVGSFVRQTGMLRQTLYNGVVTFNKMQYRKHPENGKRLSIMRPEKEWITVPIPELTIIDDETFTKVQKALDERSSKHLQRKMIPTVMTEEEKRETSIRRSKEWRRTQAATKKRANAVFGGKLYCGEHNQKITATYAKHYSCPVKGCANRNLHYDEIIKLVLDAIADLDEVKIIQHFEGDEIQQVRAHHAREIERLTQHLEDLRASINKVIDALGPDARSKEIRAFFDDKSELIQRAKLDISRHQRELTEMTVPKSLDRIIQRHNNLVARMRVWSRDPKAVVPLRNIVEKLAISNSWDDENQVWHRRCAATFDFAGLSVDDK
ncbi:recombinase family protein [Thalassospira aquimaris]|uniref:Recombinase family protein n=1 Tax=Thalassospira aquimaris TaxID=3037796 RepID=A0ABT6GFD1_9PROT|nr:recombinase family protein [Thalassospira sp. FZY0004]MDG4720726.1 recombinase family protein [Thalassospira sp. FZY0004]